MPSRTRCGEAIRRRRIGRLTYEQLTFDHDPRLPQSLAAEGLGGPATAGCTCADRVMTRGRGWSGCTARVRASRSTCCSRGPADPESWVQHRAARPAGSWFRARVADVSRHGSAGQCRGHDAGGLRGPRAGALAAAAVQRLRCRVCRWEARSPRWSRIWRDVDAVAVYTPIFGLNGMIAHHLGRGDRRCRHRRAAAVRGRGRGGVRRRSPGVEPSPPRAGSSSAPGTTGWRCASPLRCCRIGGAASCTGTREAMSGIFSPAGAAGVGAFLRGVSEQSSRSRG